jgi:hypothetical protein
MRGLLVAVAMVLSSVAAMAQSPVVRAHLEPASGVMVGQPVRLVVTVYVPNYFTGSPDFPEFEIEDAIVVMPQDRPENSNTDIGGVRYAGITEIYVIYPQQPGEFRVPPAQLTVPYAVAPPKSTTAHVALPALTFRADVPAAARGLDYFLPTTSLTMQQTWSQPLKDLRAGDTVERTITVTGDKVQAMLIPPLALEAPEGIRTYPEEPVVRDQKTPRGDFVYGRRVQAAKYFIQREGEYTLPAVELKWWNLSTNRLVTATLPAVHFAAAANPNGVAELPPEAEPAVLSPVKRVSFWRRYRSLIFRSAEVLVVAVVLLIVGWMYLPRAYRSYRAWAERRRRSEAAYFRRLQSACGRSDAEQSYVWLLRWVGTACPGESVEEVLRRMGSPDLRVEVERLGAALFARRDGASGWSGKQLGAQLRELRRSLPDRSVEREALRDLNPTAVR